MVAEFERVLTRELDFRRELRHLQMFRQAFAADPGVRFPEPHPQLSTGRVLTMELFEGVPFNRPDAIKAAGGDFGDLARRGSKAFLDMIFRDGFFHADPHPGNVLFLPPTGACPAGAIGLIDAGMVGRIDDRMRERIDRGVGAVLLKDAAAITELIVQVGDVPPRFDQPALECEVAEQLAYYHDMPLEQFQLGTTLNEMTEAIRRYHVMLPSPLALLLRVLVMLEGTGRLLAPDFNLIELLEPYKKAGVLKKLSPKRAWRRLVGTLGDWDELVRDAAPGRERAADAPAPGDGGAVEPPAPGAVGEPAGVRADGERAVRGFGDDVGGEGPADVERHLALRRVRLHRERGPRLPPVPRSNTPGGSKTATRRNETEVISPASAWPRASVSPPGAAASARGGWTSPPGGRRQR